MNYKKILLVADLNHVTVSIMDEHLAHEQAFILPNI